MNRIALLLAGHAYAKMIFLGGALQQLHRFSVAIGVKFEVIPIFVDNTKAAFGAGHGTIPRMRIGIGLDLRRTLRVDDCDVIPCFGGRKRR